jgi:hypothetical protein
MTVRYGARTIVPKSASSKARRAKTARARGGYYRHAIPRVITREHEDSSRCFAG